jgi:SPP1 gp7 family putative phage head morphogenesis protein
MATANESLLDQTISHSVGIQRYSTATVRKIIAILNRADANITEELKSRGVDGTYTTARLNKLLEALRVINSEAYAAVEKELNKDLYSLAHYEAEFQQKMITSVIPVKIDIVTPSASLLKAAVDSRPFQGKLLSEWYQGLEAGSRDRLRGTVRMGVVEGQTTDQIVKRVTGTQALQYKDGIQEVSRRGAEAMVRTSINHTVNASRTETYASNADVIKGVQWVATLDGRTTIICASRDGQVFPIDSGPRPPAHTNCRSTTAPVLKSWKEMRISLSEAPEGTRASMDGQVAASTTYQSWLEGKSSAFQDDILGPTKGKLFRDGGLTLDKFVDRNGTEYTLDELRKRESEAFAKAGL